MLITSRLYVYGELYFFDRSEMGTFCTVIRADMKGVITDVRYYGEDDIDAQVKAENRIRDMVKSESK